MAKLMIEVDTESKTMSVSVDGKAHEDVNYVTIHKYKDLYEGEEELHFCLEKTKKENGITTRESVCASKTPVETKLKNYLTSLRG